MGYSVSHGSDDSPLLGSGRRGTLRLVASATGGLIGAFQFGFATSVLNAPERNIESDLGISPYYFGIAVSIFAIGGLIAAFAAGPLADRLGRRLFLLLNSIPFAIGGALGALSQSGFMLVVSRFIVGLSCGSATVVVPMYLKEIASPKQKGAFGTLNQFAIVTGILVSELFGFGLNTIPNWWRYSVGVTCVFAALQFILYPFMARSPRWLVLKGDRDAAVRVLRELRGADDVRVEITTLEPGYTGDDDGEDDQVRRGTHTAGSEPAADDAPQPQQGAGEEGKQGAFSAARPELDPGMKSTWDTRAPLTLGDLWRDPVLRFSLIASVVLQLGQQLSAINAVFYYSTNIFAKIGVDPPELGTVLVGAVNVVATGLAVFLMDRTGRRVLLTIGSLTMIVSMIAFTVSLEVESKPLSVISMLFFVTGFEVGLGPIPWVIGAELFSSRERGVAMGVSAGVNWAANFTIGVVFKPVRNLLGHFMFIPFAVILTLVLLFTVRYVPETKGRTPEQVQADVARRLGKKP